MTWLACGRSVRLTAQRRRVAAVDWAPDGRSFFSASADGAIRRWTRIEVPLGASDAALTAAAEVLTAATIDAGLAVMPLDRAEWLDRFRRFKHEHGSFDNVLGLVVSASEWHDARARDAEELNEIEDAIHHLDRRLALKPMDGNSWLRRMHQHVLAGHWTAAEEDRRRALELVGGQEFKLWRLHFGSICESCKNFDAARWYSKE